MPDGKAAMTYFRRIDIRFQLQLKSVGRRQAVTRGFDPQELEDELHEFGKAWHL